MPLPISLVNFYNQYPITVIASQLAGFDPVLKKIVAELSDNYFYPNDLYAQGKIKEINIILEELNKLLTVTNERNLQNGSVKSFNYLLAFCLYDALNTFIMDHPVRPVLSHTQTKTWFRRQQLELIDTFFTQYKRTNNINSNFIADFIEQFDQDSPKQMQTLDKFLACFHLAYEHKLVEFLFQACCNAEENPVLSDTVIVSIINQIQSRISPANLLTNMRNEQSRTFSNAILIPVSPGLGGTAVNRVFKTNTLNSVAPANDFQARSENYLDTLYNQIVLNIDSSPKIRENLALNLILQYSAIDLWDSPDSTEINLPLNMRYLSELLNVSMLLKTSDSRILKIANMIQAPYFYSCDSFNFLSSKPNLNIIETIRSLITPEDNPYWIKWLTKPKNIGNLAADPQCWQILLTTEQVTYILSCTQQYNLDLILQSLIPHPAAIMYALQHNKKELMLARLSFYRKQSNWNEIKDFLAMRLPGSIFTWISEPYTLITISEQPIPISVDTRTPLLANMPAMVNTHEVLQNLITLLETTIGLLQSESSMQEQSSHKKINFNSIFCSILCLLVIGAYVGIFYALTTKSDFSFPAVATLTFISVCVMCCLTNVCYGIVSSNAEEFLTRHQLSNYNIVKDKAIEIINALPNASSLELLYNLLDKYETKNRLDYTDSINDLLRILLSLLVFNPAVQTKIASDIGNNNTPDINTYYFPNPPSPSQPSITI